MHLTAITDMVYNKDTYRYTKYFNITFSDFLNSFYQRL